MEHKAFSSTWCGAFMHIKEKNVFLPKRLKDLSLTSFTRWTIPLPWIPRVKMPRKCSHGNGCKEPGNNSFQKIQKTVLSTTVAELYSFMRCFGSCRFLRRLWMDISGEVADNHKRTDAKNVVPTARTIHLPEQKETIHMISMLRTKTCSGNIHDLAHIPAQNCLADCLTKASAKADNLITAVKTGRFSEVDVRPNLRTLMEHMFFLSFWCRTFLHTRENDVFFLNTFEGFSCYKFTRRIISCDVCEKSTYS